MISKYLKYLTPSLVSLFILVMLVASILINSMLVPKIYGFQVSSLDGAPPLVAKAIILPYNDHSVENIHDFKFEGKIDYMPFQVARFRLTADNCVRSIKVNGVVVPLEGNYGGDLCKYDTGMIIDLRAYLKVGGNAIEVTTWDDAAVPLGSRSFNMELVL